MFQISRFKDKGQAILTFFIILTIGIYIARNGFLGSNTDWISQHTVFPDYFRTLFYETGDLFPNYSANLGAGQNLYNFSYYGFLSPVVLLSYLFPFVKMPNYIMATSLISLATACLLFYKWLKSKGFSEFINISVSMIFLLASPMLYQTYKQIIFINYMPFLCMALIGVDRYATTKKKDLLIISVFLMIMSSFYFSVSGLLALCLYWLSVYLTGNEKLKIRDLLRNGAWFTVPILVAVLMAGILLIPTFASLLESHRDGQMAVTLSAILIPQFRLLRYAYSPYGIGLPSIVITGLIAGLFYKKRNEQILAVGMFLITVLPIFLFLLNGGLYVEDKALIPFLPIVCYLIAILFQKLESKDRLFSKRIFLAFLGTVILTIFSIEQTIYWIVVFADALIMLLLYFIYRKHPSIKLFIIPVIVMLLITNFVIQNPGKLVSGNIYREIFNPDIKVALKEVNREDPAYYRLDSLLNKDANLNRIYTGSQYLTSFYSSSYQKDYFDFRSEVFQLERPYRNYLMQPASQNPLFLTFMGVKYVRSNYAPVDYELFKEKGNIKIYRNENVFPLGYVTNDLIPEKLLYKYEFPYRQELLLHNAAVDENSPDAKISTGMSHFKSEIKPSEVIFPQVKGSNCSLTSKGKIYRVKAEEETNQTIRLQQPAPEDEILFLEMNVKNLSPLQDISMKIQNEQNRLSAEDHVYYNKNTVFHYAVSVKKRETALPVTFSTGEYEFSNVRSYTLSAIALNIRKDSPFVVSSIGTKGDVISGSVNAAEDGWFITTIPYDKNFEVAVDGKAVSFEKVNTAFVGFPITKGAHRIVFHYVSPGFSDGAIASIIGFLIFGFAVYTDQKKNTDRRDRKTGISGISVTR
ncbi:YfhO family protein [Sinanaerobacter chloroacetimidivorans]|uniref:YfhO family protein n=1 Tax=Sinanaerobacter chloroacetimidivorans TaxID=2818044 RepID=A0A8J7W139_9FIRM|nr:YfhO family protein [Sinanaerobacter chloroacetimidivorans]MBR0598459.1 YfhO family protein [Sinanaerobacter chloroacetimidivorans]